MNTELTVISGNSPNVCRDLRALACQASDGQDEFAARGEGCAPRYNSSQNLSLNLRALKGVHYAVEPISVLQWQMRDCVQVL